MSRILYALVAILGLTALVEICGSCSLIRDHIRSEANQALVESYNQPQRSQNDAAAPPPVFAPLPPSAAPAPAPEPQAITAAGFGLGLGTDNVDLRASDAIARNVLNFANSLGQHLSTTYRKTEVFSPLSVMSALALLLAGSNGKSYEQLSQVFGLNDQELQSNSTKLHEQFGLLLKDVQQPTLEMVSPQRRLDPWRYTKAGNMRSNRRSANRPSGHAIHLANGLFTQLGYTLNPDYRNVITNIYRSELQPLDFQTKPAQSRLIINDWVEQKTLGKIPNIIASEVSQATRVIMANALYFKGFWEQDFIDSATKLDNFYPNGESEAPVRVQLMGTGGTFPYYEDPQLNCRIIGMPYRGNLSTMYVIQPHQSTASRLQQLQQNLNADRIEEMISKMTRRSALLAFPKMHIVESINMKELLRRMGISSIFSELESDLSLIAEPASRPGQSDGTDRPFVFSPRSSFGKSADSLQNLDDQRSVTRQNSVRQSNMFVDEIVHKVDFEVNEQGTEAAAATITYLNKSGPDVLFRADAPFILLLRHDATKLVLFYGIINEPPVSK
ncbi:serine protease inhibitor 28Dc [Scaptodrosophila lebanonensis]|uniref:Serine protease inhibitor 28Dc n=1 Tax=Drosophila lebanonensis TaxID=7225 RepID=A0A6J2U3A0_DROLE|nr:serine protease inhibitor 28Dc [Scaptodrosophila lebanonensis]